MLLLLSLKCYIVLYVAMIKTILLYYVLLFFSNLYFNNICFLCCTYIDDSVDVTSEPLEQDISVAASHTPNKRPQLEVQLGGAVTLQCPQGTN